jgi:hypothetical protein
VRKNDRLRGRLGELIYFLCVEKMLEGMKKEKAIKELKIQRPRRAVVSEKEALKRMKDFSKRKEQFLATARTGKSRGVRS